MASSILTTAACSLLLRHFLVHTLIFSGSIWITPLLIQWPRNSTFVWAPFHVLLLFLLHPEHCTQGSKPPVSDYKRLCHRGFPLQTGQGKSLSYPLLCGTRPELGRYSSISYSLCTLWSLHSMLKALSNSMSVESIQLDVSVRFFFWLLEKKEECMEWRKEERRKVIHWWSLSLENGFLSVLSLRSFSRFDFMVSEPTRELGCWNNNSKPACLENQTVPVCFFFFSFMFLSKWNGNSFVICPIPQQFLW